MRRATRLLMAGDFFPDLEFTHDTLPATHSAAFAGHAILLILCSDESGWRMQEQVIAKKVALFCEALPVLVAMFTETAHAASPAAKQYRVRCSVARPLFFSGGREQNTRVILIGRDGKILWLDDLDSQDDVLCAEIAANIGINSSGRVPPVLVVERAIPKGLCADLISSYIDSEHKVQGRVGLSAPKMDETRKRVSHINLSPELARAVDWHLIYSLLPMLERCFDVRLSHRVAYKVALYDAADAGFFNSHRDNSDAGTSFRRYALSLALNDDWLGGGLNFPEYSDHLYRIGAGNALIFPVSLLHRVEPVKQGQRFVLLSFLYGENGARERREQMPDPSLLDGVYSDTIDTQLMQDYYQFYAPESRFQPHYQSNVGDPDFITQWRNKSGTSQ